METNTHHRMTNGNRHCVGVVQVEIESFGYRHDAPPDADITLDVRRHFRNPHHDPAMVNLTGLDRAVRMHVMTTAGVALLVHNTGVMLAGLVADVGDPRQQKVRLAVGCAGGRHRSVAIAEELADMLIPAGFGVDVYHRDLHSPILPPGPG